jgi:S-adenosylmethionine decarboxylase
MGYSKGKRQLQGFNNLTKMVSFNLYDFVVARTDDERESYRTWLDANFRAEKITSILRKVAEIIDAEIISISDQDYQPVGASSVILVSDAGFARDEAAGRIGIGAHLDKSHLCAHTYPDWTDPSGVCSVRLDINVATCGDIIPLRALDYLLRTLSNDVVIIDYVVRGFTRDPSGKRVYMDHEMRSIQDYIGHEIKTRYDFQELVLQNEHIWQTKMIVKHLEPAAFFKPGTDPTTEDNRKALEAVRREMNGVYYGWPS